jgi:type I restriction enzyme M protein
LAYRRTCSSNPVSPVCILVLKKCKKPDDILFINVSGEGNFQKGKRQNTLLPEHIDTIVETYKHRKKEDLYSRPVSLEEIDKNGFNLNISRYVSTSFYQQEIDLHEVNKRLVDLDKT